MGTRRRRPQSNGFLITNSTNNKGIYVHIPYKDIPLDDQGDAYVVRIPGTTSQHHFPTLDFPVWRNH